MQAFGKKKVTTKVEKLLWSLDEAIRPRTKKYTIMKRI